jgi:pantothenate kinase
MFEETAGNQLKKKLKKREGKMRHKLVPTDGFMN